MTQYFKSFFFAVSIIVYQWENDHPPLDKFIFRKLTYIFINFLRFFVFIDLFINSVDSGSVIAYLYYLRKTHECYQFHAFQMSAN